MEAKRSKNKPHMHADEVCKMSKASKMGQVKQCARGMRKRDDKGEMGGLSKVGNEHSKRTEQQ